MKALKDRIIQDGKCLEGGILKVDNFINHQMDPILMEAMAEEFVRRFSGVGVDKVLTVEASGIAPAIMVGYLLKKPVVFAKKVRPCTMGDMFVTKVLSFTKKHEYEICISRSYLSKGEKVLFIDDFLANGNAAKGVLDLARQAGATVVGMGFIIEKSFQGGGSMLRSLGCRVESLAVIESLDGCAVKFKEVPVLNSHNKEEYPPMHTAEHILNATMVKMFGCPRSRNAHIERKKSKCDYLLQVEPTTEQIGEIEARVNEVIGRCLEVSVEFMTKEQASGLVDLSKLPEDASETLRIVKVGDYDACACIGAHVSNTKEIGQFKILSHSYTDGVWRLRWKVVE